MQEAQLDVIVKESHCITGAYCGLHTHIFDSTLDFHRDTALINLTSGNLFAGRRRKIWFNSITSQGEMLSDTGTEVTRPFMVQDRLTSGWITNRLRPGIMVGSEEHASTLSSHERSACSIALSLLAQGVRSQDSPRRKSKTSWQMQKRFQDLSHLRARGCGPLSHSRTGHPPGSRKRKSNHSTVHIDSIPATRSTQPQLVNQYVETEESFSEANVEKSIH